MTPKEQALDMVLRMGLWFDKQLDKGDIEYISRPINNFPRECALIAVNYIIMSNPHSNPLNTDPVSTMKFWLEVKKEIEYL
jgi:hypothetical protein